MLDVGRLRVLREVARAGSMSGAAAALSFSQPAISHQMARLERETGTRLLERSSRGVRLTEAGELLARHAESILGRLARAEAELDDLLSLREGRLRVGAFPSAFVHLASSSIAEMRRRHPGVQVVFDEVSLEEGSARLEAGELDLVVAFEYDVAPSPAVEDLARFPLLDDPMYLLLAAAHPAVERTRLRLADLRDEDWITVTQGGPASRAIYGAFSRAGIEPRIVLETDDLLATQGLVAAGVGVSLVPGMSLPTLREDLVVRFLGTALPTRHVFALAPADGHRAASAAAMVEVLAEQAERLWAMLAGRTAPGAA